MTTIDDRGKVLENKYAHDQHKLFRIEARACKLLGLWAADRLSIYGDAAESYAKDVVASNLEEAGLDDVKKKILKDFAENGIETSSHMIDIMIEKKMAIASDQIENDIKSA